MNLAFLDMLLGENVKSKVFICPNSCYFRDAHDIKINKQVGHMLRTKLSHVNEGGVAAGLGALDSVILVNQEACCRCPT